MPNLFEEFRTIVAALGAARVPYAICGGIAMSIHTRPRATNDIDPLAPPAAVASIADSPLPCGFVRHERAPTQLANGEVVMHRLTKIGPGDPEVLLLNVIEVRPGATERAWQARDLCLSVQRAFVGPRASPRTASLPIRPCRHSATSRGHDGGVPATI
jgi:hypothetical protein